MLKLWCHCQHATSRFPRGFWLGALLLLSACLPTAQAATTFNASLDRDTITLGESAILSLQFNGNGPLELTLPTVPNLRFNGPSQSSRQEWVNGQFSASVTYSYQVIPSQAGTYTIPPIAVTVDNQRLASPALSLQVLPPTAPSAQAVQSGSELAFIKLVVPKKQLYLGEAVMFQLQIYVRDVIQRVGGFQLVSFPADGFSIGQFQNAQGTQTRIGNSVYRVYPLVTTLRTIKAGSLTLGPLTAKVTVELPRARRSGMWADLFESGEARELSLTAEAEPIESLALPTDNVPPGFTGAVGTYTMTASAGPTNVAAGDPITLRIQISGRGALDGLTLPDLSSWREFKAYPPTAKLEAPGLGLQGSKSFEQVVVPQSPEVKQLPAFSFSYFDPDRKSYHTLTQPAVPLTVRPGGTAVAPTVVAGTRNPQDPPAPTPDIVHIKPRVGAVAQISTPLLQRSWFLGLQLIPLMAWLAALAWRQQQERLANNPRLRRQRQVAQLVREGLPQLRKLAGANQAQEFFATLVRLLQEQLGERLDLPASAITEAVIDERLRPGGLPAPTLSQLQELFQTCNLARYAPIQTSQELAALVPKTETVLRELQAWKG